MMTVKAKRKLKAERPRFVSEHERETPGRSEARMRKAPKRGGSKKQQAQWRRAHRLVVS